jgi:hypothetical protein
MGPVDPKIDEDRTHGRSDCLGVQRRLRAGSSDDALDSIAPCNQLFSPVCKALEVFPGTDRRRVEPALRERTNLRRQASIECVTPALPRIVNHRAISVLGLAKAALDIGGRRRQGGMPFRDDLRCCARRGQSIERPRKNRVVAAIGRTQGLRNARTHAAELFEPPAHRLARGLVKLHRFRESFTACVEVRVGVIEIGLRAISEILCSRQCLTRLGERCPQLRQRLVFARSRRVQRRFRNGCSRGQAADLPTSVFCSPLDSRQENRAVHVHVRARAAHRHARVRPS